MKRPIALCMAIFLSVIVLQGCSGSGSSPDGAPQNDDSGNGGTGTTDGLTSLSYDWDPATFSHVIDVGPGLDYEEPHLVPWDTVTGSTLVRIHKRETPYRSKWVVTTIATAEAPLVITGIDEDGERPVITGDGAQTLSGLYYLNEGRSVIKVGNYTGEDDTSIPAHVFIENLDIRSCRSPYTFTDRHGSEQTYTSSAAAIHIEEGDTITVRGCVLHDSANGLFTSHFTNDILISGNHIFNNGIEGSIYQHNTYTESVRITYEFNHFGPLRDACLGNNLKDRSAGTVIRYNWIESGNRQLDLVETSHLSLFNDPSYNETYVYGNILVEYDNTGNNQIIHYGGDGDGLYYREGTLYLYHNTIVSTRSGNTTLVNLSTDAATADIQNNIIYTTATGSHLALTSGRGNLSLVSNWIKDGYRITHESTSTVDFLTDSFNILGDNPLFADEGGEDFSLAAGSACIDSTTTLPVAVADYPVTAQYIIHIDGMARTTEGSGPDIGAFEFIE